MPEVSADLRSLLSAVPRTQDLFVRRITHLQAHIRGWIVRYQWIRSIGKSVKRPKAVCHLLLPGEQPQSARPLTVSVRGNWMGRISQISLFDHQTDTITVIPLHWYPPLQCGLPHGMSLAIHCELLPANPRLLSVGLSFIDQQTAAHWERTVILSDLQQIAQEAGDSAEDWSDVLCQAIASDGQQQPAHALSTVGIRTDTQHLEIARFGLWHAATGSSMGYLFVRVYQHGHLTCLSMTAAADQYCWLFVLAREYLDRSVNLQAICHRLLQVMGSHEQLAALLSKVSAPFLYLLFL